MLRIKEKKQFLALIESLTENEPEGTLPVTIARSSETPDVLVIHYREGMTDETMEFVHGDGRITS